MSAQDPQLGETTANTGGVSITFSEKKGTVLLLFSRYSTATICYIGINGVPASATPGADRVGIIENGTLRIYGNITSIGLKTDAGTAIVGYVAYAAGGVD